jgi:NodT family efflux transporter outer membrane factor (OMF) lipoprotein
VLSGLIDTALTNNQELHILLQEVAVSRAESEARRGELLPFGRLGGTSGVDKVSKNTRNGAVEENLAIRPGRRFPDPLPNYGMTADLEWEVDIWRRLRNGRDASIQRYLASIEGRRFAVTHLVSEIAESYYELLSLDAHLEIFERMLGIQERVLESVRQKKSAGRVTELAVRRFEAEVLKNRSRLFDIRQKIVETENRINTLTGRYPGPIERSANAFDLANIAPLDAGLPSDLLRHRPDIRRAEMELKAAGLEVKAAAARFYPALNLKAALGIESFTLGSPILAKENLAYGATANLVGPLINRSAIKAAFNGASARQVAAVYRYQQVVLKAYTEVLNELSMIRNTAQGYDLKSRQVEALVDSISLSTQLFDSARADYSEVLLTQREALEARVELVEMRQAQLMAAVKAYRALGGGAEAPTDPSAGQKPR